MVFIQQMVNGIALGSVYALIALGYTMVYGIVRLINFAHGDILMIGSFAGLFTIAALQNNSLLISNPAVLAAAFLISMAVCAFFGVVIEKTCYKPLRNAPKINALITAIGVSIVLENGARMLPFIGANPKQFPTFTKESFQGSPTLKHFFDALEKIGISPVQSINFIVAVALMIILNYVVNHTKVGKAMKSVSFDMTASRLMGIDVNKIISFTFAIGAALAGAAGILFAIAYPSIDPYMGIMPGLKAFVAAVLGGIGSIPGAMLGGFLIGIVEILTRGFVSSNLADAVVFGILIVILVAKPSGILGKHIREKV